MLAAIVLSAPALALYVGPLLPILTALVTKSSAWPGLKAVVHIVLAAVVALLAGAIQNGTDVKVDGPFLGVFAVTLLVGIGAHFGVTKPLGITGADGNVSAMKVPFVPELG